MVVRVRQHVNPLSHKYQAPIAPPNWNQVYTRPNQPLHLDLGCGKGQFLLKMAQQSPNWNFLGVEIRQPLVTQANQRQAALGLQNLCFLFGNANCSLLKHLKPGVLQGVTIQFPDPWFKRRHQKRRLVQPQLVTELAACLSPGGYLLLQSDIEEVAVEMRDCFGQHPAFVNQSDADSWLSQNPLPATSDREQVTLEKGQPVYRTLFRRR